MLKGKKILVVCYSFSNGNTRMIARQLQEALRADYAEIETVIPYPPYGGGMAVRLSGKDRMKWILVSSQTSSRLR